MRRRAAAALSLAALGCAPAAGLAAPSLSSGVLAPNVWSNARTAGVLWVQNDFSPSLPGPAAVQVNLAADGSPLSLWQTRALVLGPLISGSSGVPSMTLADLEGRHQVRVVVPGALGSPLPLGTLLLDRTPPEAADVALTPAGGPVEARWTQVDALSGSDPAVPPSVEVNASPAGDAAGEWVPFAEQPAPGDGPRVARTGLAGLADGPHLVRVRSRDVAGNAGERVLGTVLADGTPPAVDGVRALSAVPPPPYPPEVQIAYTALDPDPGVGVAPGPDEARVGPPGAGWEADWRAPGSPGNGQVAVRLPGPGVHAVTVRVRDRLGNVGESGPLTVYVPPPADLGTGPRPPAERLPSAGGAAAGPGVRAAYAAARRLHARRGLALRARVRVARTPADWRRMVGASEARRFGGYLTFDGRMLLGPHVVRGLEGLRTARARAAAARRGRPGGPARAAWARRAPSRADIDRIAAAAAVVLHETLHATGPRAMSDVRGTRTGRALEEGLTEAVTVDLLVPFVRAMRVPPPLRARLVAAARRYRPAYPAETGWVRRLSAEATGAPAGGRRARAWRLAAADGWGDDRWARLAEATGRDEASLRAAAPIDGGP